MMTRKLVKIVWKGQKKSLKIDLGMGFLFVVTALYILYSMFLPDQPLPMVQEYTDHHLVRIPQTHWFGGILAGFAYYFAIPLWILRLGFVVAVLVLDDIGNLLIVAYILLWIFMPAINYIPMDFVTRVG
jgi:phage shock protein PspC (stress-responsive transcriptional regulator)